MRNLADRVIYLLRFFAAIELIIETAAATAQVRQPGAEANYKPLLQIKRLKKDLLHQLDCFTKRLEDFNVAFGPVHSPDSEMFSTK
jgi:hypothetical protein